MTPIPSPHDIPLPLPAGRGELEVAIVLLFLAHILFVNLMVGGSLMTVIYEIAGLRDRRWDALAREVASTITVSKSMAVVLGVAPLLAINVLYTVYFYSANALTATAWMLIVPVVAMAFLITYAHKYSWDALADHKGLHIAIGLAGALLFLALPLVFLANVNLMLFPERWADVQGFLTALLIPNVLPRYLHFVVASLGVSGLVFAGWFSRQRFAGPVLESIDRPALRAHFASVAFGASALQFLAGPVLLLSLPPHGLSWALVFNVSLAALLAAGALHFLWQETRRPEPALGRRYWLAVGLLTGTVIFMAYARHLYREDALEPHQARMAEVTENYAMAVQGAQMRLAAGTPRVAEGEPEATPGEKTFNNMCAACHAVDARLVGPPLAEFAPDYEADPAAMVAWFKAPQKRRPDYPEMPPLTMPESEYLAVARYTVALGLGKEIAP